MADIDIDFDDAPQLNSPLRFLPAELQSKAFVLAPEYAYTVLELDPPGSGHNASLLKVAAICYKMGVEFEDVVTHLENQYDPSRIDYRTAPRRAVQRVWGCEGNLEQITSGEDFGSATLQEECLLRFRRVQKEEIPEHSPHRDPEKVDPLKIISSLYKEEEIINLQMSAFEVGTLAKAGELGKLFKDSNTTIDHWKFLNPAHFKKEKGVENPLDKDRRISTRCNANVKARPWVVLEMDTDDSTQTERFTGFCLQLAKFAPLHMVVDTGGKSLHFWFDGRTGDKANIRGIFKLACLHGADPRMAVKSQIARMPNVSAEKEGRRRQTLLYFDPEGEKKAKQWDLVGFEDFLRLNKQVEFFYHGRTKNFYMVEDSQSWVALDRGSVKTHLAEMGFRQEKGEVERVSPVDSMINTLQKTKCVDAVIPSLCGRQAGYYEENSYRFIVQRSPELLTPAKGTWGTIRQLLDSQFGWCEPQLQVFLGWLSSSVKDFRNEGRRISRFSQAQFLHIAGEKDAGKSLLLSNILPALFGHRAETAIDLFKKGAQEYNAHLFGAELLYLDDSKELETGYAFRAAFGEKIKELTVGAGGGASFRGMFQDKISVRPWWRFIRMMNTEPATLATLPPLEDGIEDKLILLRARSMNEGPFAALKLINPNWFAGVEASIKKEIPAFLYYLLKEHEIPAPIRDPNHRYAVMSYKNPELILDFEQTEPHTQLLHKIDCESVERLFGQAEFGDPTDPVILQTPWKGAAHQLYDVLMSVGTRTSQMRFQRMCPTTQVLVSQLRRLETTRPSRVAYSRRQDEFPQKIEGGEYWIIYPASYKRRKKEIEVCQAEINEDPLGIW